MEPENQQTGEAVTFNTNTLSYYFKLLCIVLTLNNKVSNFFNLFIFNYVCVYVCAHACLRTCTIAFMRTSITAMLFTASEKNY